MKIDQYGQIQVSELEAFQALYTGKISDLTHVFLDDHSLLDQYNSACDRNADQLPRLKPYTEFDQDISTFDSDLQKYWFMPREYQDLDITRWLIDQCQTQEQKNRVNFELELYEKFNLITVLKYLKYLVDTMRSEKIVWGVGRGSSVASYCLFLIGVHKIDSLKWQLDISEFLK